MNRTSEITPYISPAILAVHGEEVHERVLASLDLIPQILNHKKEEWNIDESKYHFLTVLRVKAPDILHEPDGIARFEKICLDVHAILEEGKQPYMRYPMGLDHHWEKGIDTEAGDGALDVYYTDEILQEAERYLKTAGVIQPPEAP